MRMFKKSMLSVFVIVFMAVGFLTACSGGGGGGSKADPTPTPPNTQKPDNDKGKDEVTEVGYPDAITYWVGLNPNASATMKSYAEIAAYKKLEEITGTKVDFQHPTAGQEKDQFNLMFASGELPDVVEYNWLSVPKGPDNAIAEGRILRLNELIEEHAPNLNGYLEENPEIKKLITSDDGNIYVFPFLRGGDLLLTVNGPVMRNDWLEELDLKVPTTLDEWEEVLTAFRDRDPNGNNGADEIPFLFGPKELNYNNQIVGAFGITNAFYNDNGTVKFGPLQPEYKEFLTLMNDWYTKGLIDQDYATTDGQLRDAKVTSNELGAFFGYAGSGLGRLNTLAQETDPDFQLVSVPYPKKSADGPAPIGQKDSVYTGIGAAIAKSAKNPEQIAKWLDYKFSEEGHFLFNFGIEGESYELVSGYPTYTDQIMKNPEGLPVTQAMAQYFISAWSGPMVQDERYIEQYYETAEQKEALVNWTQTDSSRLMPPVTPTADESAKLASIMNEINTYHEEMLDRFVMGSEPIDNFGKYVDVIKQMGIEEAVAIQQAALERFNNR